MRESCSGGDQMSKAFDIKIPPLLNTDHSPDEERHFLPYGLLLNRRRRPSLDLNHNRLMPTSCSSSRDSSPSFNVASKSPVRDADSKMVITNSKLARYRSPPPKISRRIASGDKKPMFPSESKRRLSKPKHFHIPSRPSTDTINETESFNMAKKLLPAMRGRSSSMDTPSNKRCQNKLTSENNARSLSPVSICRLDELRMDSQLPVAFRDLHFALPDANDLVSILRKATNYPAIQRVPYAIEHRVTFDDEPTTIEFDVGSPSSECIFRMDSTSFEKDTHLTQTSPFHDCIKDIDRNYQRSNALPPIHVTASGKTLRRDFQEEIPSSGSSFEDHAYPTVHSTVPESRFRSASVADNGVFCEVVHSYTPRSRSKPRNALRNDWSRGHSDDVISDASGDFSDC